MTESPVTADQDCPKTEELAQILDQAADVDHKLSNHLAVCRSCQQIMEWIAGDESFWKSAEESLKVTAFEDNQYRATTKIVDSICALSSGEDPRNLDPLCQHEIQQMTSLLEPASHPELLGRIGRYELEQLVGRGGMGLVFRGYDTDLHRIVAIKTLAIHLVPIKSARERFIREGRACASLVHPHIVPVHDVINEGPTPALVMQYVAGPTLEAYLGEHGPLRVEHALSLMEQLCEALNAAHGKGFVHRDIKPGNVLLEVDASRALLTDFGLVRTLDDATLTRSGLLAGTPEYMSPEQARGERAEVASDLFSMGSLFYCMLAGHAPFRAVEPMAVMNQICHATHTSIRELQPNVPIEVSELIDRLLEKEPDSRLSTAEELGAALIALRKSTDSRRSQGGKSQAGSQSWLSKAKNLSSARRAVAVLVSVAVLMMAVAGCLMFTLKFGSWSQSVDDQVDALESRLMAIEQTSEPEESLFENIVRMDDEIHELDREIEDYELDREFEKLPLGESGTRLFDSELNKIWSDLHDLESELRQ